MKAQIVVRQTIEGTRYVCVCGQTVSPEFCYRSAAVLFGIMEGWEVVE